MATAELENEGVALKHKPDYFVRFNLGQRVEHAVLMASFTVLTVTGLAQRFSGAGWADWIILGMGGIEYARLIHRAFAFLFVLSALYHFSYQCYSVFARRANPSMLPTVKDARDVVATVRYSFGAPIEPPRFGRFDIFQKFEYWGLVFGSTVLIITGAILMFPTTVTRFLPGQIIAAAVEFHGFEATLAALTIVVWHFYHVLLKPGIFPADTSIHTGKISRERLIEEHPLEYAELADKEAARQDSASPSEAGPGLKGGDMPANQ